MDGVVVTEILATCIAIAGKYLDNEISFQAMYIRRTLDLVEGILYLLGRTVSRDVIKRLNGIRRSSVDSSILNDRRSI